MDNKEFCLLIGVNDIPWNRITGCYNRATNFPDLLSKFTSNEDSKRQNAIKEISLNIEHQSTLYTVTPLTLNFLFRCLSCRKMIEDDNLTEFINNILDLILRIINIVKFNIDNIEIKNPKIENLEGILSEEYLWDEYESEEQEELNWEENICSEDYYYSLNLNVIDVAKYNYSTIEHIGLPKWNREKAYQIMNLINQLKTTTHNNV